MKYPARATAEPGQIKVRNQMGKSIKGEVKPSAGEEGRVDLIKIRHIVVYLFNLLFIKCLQVLLALGE